MRRFAGSCRFVYNKALALQKERHEQGQKKLGYAGLCQLLTAWRHSADTAWLADAPVHPLQQALQDLERAYSHFFAQRAGFPKFKKKGRSDSFRYPDAQANPAGPGQQPHLSAQTWLAALSQQPRRGGQGQERHRIQARWQVVRVDPDRAGG